MKAVLISLIVVVSVAILGAGGFLAYNFLMEYQQQAAQLEQEQTESAGKAKSGGRRVITRLKIPKNESDVLENLAYASSKNQDAVGWLRIPGTDINNAIMQGDDNLYYERRNEDGQDDIYGCYFADYECGLGLPDEFSPNTVIYGHSDLKDNPDGERFSQLFRFTKLDFAQQTPYLYTTTQDGTIMWEIFSVFYTDTSLDYIQVHLTQEQKAALVGEALTRSLYDYDVQPAQDERILTLSTCSVKYGTDGSQRFVVMARMCTPEEQAQESKILVPRAAQAE